MNTFLSSFIRSFCQWISPLHRTPRRPRPRSTAIRWRHALGYNQFIAAESGFLKFYSGWRVFGSIRMFDSKDEAEGWLCDLAVMFALKVCSEWLAMMHHAVMSTTLKSTFFPSKRTCICVFLILNYVSTIQDHWHGKQVILKFNQNSIPLSRILWSVATHRWSSPIPSHCFETETGPFAVLHHAQIICDVMSVYQSSFL